MKAFVVPNYQKNETTVILEQLRVLSVQYGLELYPVPNSTAGLAFPEISSVQTKQLEQCDVIIAIGGDGTIMHCARLSASFSKPIMGINAGMLGFLAQVEPRSLQNSLRRLTQGDYTVEYRSAVAATFDKPHLPPLDFAINDILVQKAPGQNLARFDILCDGKEVDSYRADGLVLSTSTGSTAYNLSAGGPVIDPRLSVMTLIPICPHSVSVRPLVFSIDRTLTVRSTESPLVIIADGNRRREAEPGTAVTISAAELRASFVTFHEQEFFEIVTTKIKQRG